MRILDIFLGALEIILSALWWIVMVWVILSWILFFTRQSKFRWRYRGFYNILEQLDDLLERMSRPFLRPFRRLMRKVDTAGIDWSPLLLMLTIWILRQLLLYARLAILAP